MHSGPDSIPVAGAGPGQIGGETHRSARDSHRFNPCASLGADRPPQSGELVECSDRSPSNVDYATDQCFAILPIGPISSLLQGANLETTIGAVAAFPAGKKPAAAISAATSNSTAIYTIAALASIAAVISNEPIRIAFASGAPVAAIAAQVTTFATSATHSPPAITTQPAIRAVSTPATIAESPACTAGATVGWGSSGCTRSSRRCVARIAIVSIGMEHIPFLAKRITRRVITEGLSVCKPTEQGQGEQGGCYKFEFHEIS